MTKKIKLSLFLAYVFSFFLPFERSIFDGHKSREVVFGFQTIGDFLFPFLIFFAAVLLYFMNKDKRIGALLLLLAFLYISWILFSWNTFNIPLPVLIDFIKERFQGKVYGFHINFALGLALFSWNFIDKIKKPD